MIFQLKVSQGQGWSDNSFKAVLKQGVAIPNNTASFGHQFKNFQGASAFFFSDHSMLVNKLSNLVK